MSAAPTIVALGKTLQLQVMATQNVNFNTNQIPGSAAEPSVIGAVSVQKMNTISKPITGKEGVFVVYVETVNEAAPLKDYKGPQSAQIQSLQPRVDYEVYNALKENANVVEHLTKFGY
jgi:hypothetical protein